MVDPESETDLPKAKEITKGFAGVAKLQAHSQLFEGGLVRAVTAARRLSLLKTTKTKESKGKSWEKKSMENVGIGGDDEEEDDGGDDEIRYQEKMQAEKQEMIRDNEIASLEEEVASLAAKIGVDKRAQGKRIVPVKAQVVVGGRSQMSQIAAARGGLPKGEKRERRVKRKGRKERIKVRRV